MASIYSTFYVPVKNSPRKSFEAGEFCGSARNSAFRFPLEVLDEFFGRKISPEKRTEKTLGSFPKPGEKSPARRSRRADGAELPAAAGRKGLETGRDLFPRRRSAGLGKTAYDDARRGEALLPGVLERKHGVVHGSESGTRDQQSRGLEFEREVRHHDGLGDGHEQASRTLYKRHVVAGRRTPSHGTRRRRAESPPLRPARRSTGRGEPAGGTARPSSGSKSLPRQA